MIVLKGISNNTMTDTIRYLEQGADTFIFTSYSSSQTTIVTLLSLFLT